MNLSSSFLVMATILLSQHALALPFLQNPSFQYCSESAKDDFKDVEERLITGAPESVTGDSCISSKSQACSITKRYSWSK